MNLTIKIKKINNMWMFLQSLKAVGRSPDGLTFFNEKDLRYLTVTRWGPMVRSIYGEVDIEWKQFEEAEAIWKQKQKRQNKS
jgi:hypothetical protein